MRGPVEHTRTISNRTDVVLKFWSNAATPEATPIFFSGQTINGTVELSIDKKSNFKSVTVKIRGQRRTLYHSNFTAVSQFMDVSTTVWPLPSSSGVKASQCGLHKCNFSLPIPQTSSRVGFDGLEIALPPTFSQIGFSEYIVYDMIISIERSFFNWNLG